jgi:peptidoglycan/xylan/chitin deacetylase (PgdA/CDA1 family)
MMSSIPVLCYHQVSPHYGITPKTLDKHLSLISRLGFTTITLDELYAIITGKHKQTRPSVVITFDDCTLDNWVYAMPVLVRRNMHGVFFAITRFLDSGPARWQQKDQPSKLPQSLSTPEALTKSFRGDRTGFMNKEEVRYAVHDLSMDIQSHMATHQPCFISQDPVGTLADDMHWSHRLLLPPDASSTAPVFDVGSAYAYEGHGLAMDGSDLAGHIGTPELRRQFCLTEARESRQTLESITHTPCDFLCWPWGHFDHISLEAAREAGYKATFTLERGYVGPGSDPMRICRIPVGNTKSPGWLRRKLLVYGSKWGARIFQKRFKKR